jgi:glycine betaine/proline transport system substrate-binding protein
MTYMQEAILEDSLGMEVEVNEVQGGGIAFSSVAQGNADFFNEAWLPTTHEGPWSNQKDDLQKLGYTYKGTSAGLAIPTYVEVDSMPDLAQYQGELDGTINGIEAGANVNDQTRNTLERYGLGDRFEVAAASGPATWQALKTAIENNEPIVVTAWKPHWKWSVYDLKYIDGAHTGHNVDIWGEAEDIFSIVGNDFVDRFPREAVCFLKEFEANDAQVGSLMDAFRNREDTSKREAAQQWIEDNPDHVNQWMQQTRECASSDEPIETLPDDATYSS